MNIYSDGREPDYVQSVTKEFGFFSGYGQSSGRVADRGVCVVRAAFLVSQLLSFVEYKLCGGFTYQYLNNLVECEFNYNNVYH